MRKSWVNLPEEYLTSIGRAIVCFNILEGLLTDDINYMIAMLVVRDPPVVNLRIGRILTANASFSRKIDLLAALYRELSGTEEEPAELNTLLKRAAQAEEKRNKVVHSFWAGSTRPGTISRLKFTVKRKRGLVTEFEQMTPQEVDDIADFIDEVAFEAAQFSSGDTLMLRVWKSLQSAPKK